MKYDGKTYILPYSIYFYGVIVNKTLLSELNIPIPGYDWTVENLVRKGILDNEKGEKLARCRIATP